VFLAVLIILNFSVLSFAQAATPTVLSAKITGTNTVTITYSESVNTAFGDYGSFTGALNKRTITSLLGSGSDTIKLVFDGSAFPADASGGFSIANTVKSASDGSSLQSGQYSVTDGQAPLLSSFSVTSNLASKSFVGTGNIISIILNTNELVSNPVMTVNGHTIVASGNYNGPYTAIYTITSSDAPDVIPVAIRLTDIAGNKTDNYFTFGEKSSPKIVSATPAVSATTAASATPATVSSTSTSASDLQSQLIQLQTQLSTMQGAQSSNSSANTNSSIYSHKFNSSLKVGSKGADVTALQQRLTAEGLYSGPANGNFGPLTEAAVKKYQAQHGIDQLGNVGPVTRAALNK